MAGEPVGTSEGKGPMPPHTQLFDLLSEAERAELLAWAIGHEKSFKPAKVYHHGGEDGTYVDLDQRNALKLRDLGPIEQVLNDRLMERLPAIMEGTGYRGPPPSTLEFELNAYGDGGFFGRHIDISTGRDRVPLGAKPGEDRVITAVYYFHAEPKGFTGGALRLFRFGVEGNAAGGDFVAFEPLQNSILAFPSWASHDVEPVSCPSGRFVDYRFGLNCWFCRELGA